MKVAFTLDPFHASGGGSFSFARVLAEALPSFGMKVVFQDDADIDVVLVFAHIGSGRALERHRRRGVRVVHRLDERIDLKESFARRRKHWRIAYLNTLADMTIFQSEFVRLNMGPRCKAASWRVIHNGVDGTVFRNDGEKKVLEGRPAVLHVSWSVGESKRLDRLGELLEEGPTDLVLHCVGRQAESRLQWLRHPRVRLHGPRSREEVAAFMRSADLLFFPSEREPCPNTVLEAMASGLPVIYHPSGGTLEIIDGAGVPITSSVHHAIESVLAEHQTLRERASHRAGSFCSATVAKRYAEAIHEAVRMPQHNIGPLWSRVWSSCHL